MSELPPFEPDLRKQLSRRASGRLPDDLLAGVRARLETAPDRPDRRPRNLSLAYGLAAAALVVLLSVGLVLPLALYRPNAAPVSGYPGVRALTTAELSKAVASGYAINTPLVAQVTIDPAIRPCSWNRYPDMGGIQGTDGQICVLGYEMSFRFEEKRSGVFAFRLLAPGVVGLIGELDPGPSQLAHRVSDEWPTDGSAFLVEGHLGGTPLPCAAASAEVGDVLKPAGMEECLWSWLSEDGSAAPTDGLGVNAAGSPFVDPSFDLLAVRGKARHVEAGGARQIDGIPNATTAGFFVVEPVGGPCLGASPISSVGCFAWRVLARVPPLSMPAVPSPSPSGPEIWDPGSRPLDYTNLPRAMSVSAPGQLLVAEIGIKPAPDCQVPFDSAMYQVLGRVQGPAEPICVVGLADGLAWHRPSLNGGIFAFRFLEPGLLAYVDEIRFQTSHLAFAADQTWPDEQTIVARGWVVSMPASYPCPSYAAKLQPLDPDSPNCPDAWLTAGPMREDQARAAAEAGKAHRVALPYLAPDDPARVVSTEGVYLIRDETRVCRANDPDLPDRAACSWQILGRIAPLALPPAPPPTATPAPPATPVAFLPGTGLVGPGGRPMTQAELALAWAADPKHLAGRIVITKGAVHSGFLCWDAGAANASAPLGHCNLGVLEGSIAPEGYWAVRVGSDGRLSVVGEVTILGGLFVSTVPQFKAASLEMGQLVVVSGLLAFAGDACDVLPTLPGSGVCSPSTLEGGGVTIPVQPGAHASFGTGANPSADLYLVRRLDGGQAEILARLETISGEQ